MQFFVLAVAALLLRVGAEHVVHVSGVGPIEQSWLRDHCIACGNLGAELGKATRSWTALLSTVRTNMSVAHTELLDDGISVRVRWSDGFNDTIDKVWLQQNAPGLSSSNLAAAEEDWISSANYEPWTNHTAVPTMDFGHAGNSTWRLNFYRTLRRHGIVVLETAADGVKDDSDDNLNHRDNDDWMERKIEPLFQVANSPYGTIWTTQGYGIPQGELVNATKTVSWLAKRVEAVADARLEPHTDTTWWNDPASVIVFYMEEPASLGGGETILVDGLAAAEHLRMQDPDAFTALTEVGVTWQYFPEDTRLGYITTKAVPIIQLDSATGAISHIRWSNKDRGVLRCESSAKSALFYRGYHKLAALLDGPQFQRKLKLQPGTFLFIDNWR